MRRLVIGIGVLLVVAAYVAGYWPAERRAAALQVDVDTLRGQLATAEAQVRLGALLGQLLAATDAVEANNYGHAQQLSSAFFDAVRAEAALTPEARFKAVLDATLQVRDRVTAGLTRTERPTLDLLRDAELRLRDALGYPRAS